MRLSRYSTSRRNPHAIATPPGTTRADADARNQRRTDMKIDSWPGVILGASLLLSASVGWAWLLKTVLAP